MTTPNPGSPEAIAQHCSCTVLDNGHGRGAYVVDRVWQFWYSEGCPIHAMPIDGNDPPNRGNDSLIHGDETTEEG